MLSREASSLKAHMASSPAPHQGRRDVGQRSPSAPLSAERLLWGTNNASPLIPRVYDFHGEVTVPPDSGTFHS